MKLTDLLIIYFACGAPFGVYQVTTAPKPLTPMSALRIFFRVSCWPVFGGFVLIRLFYDNQRPAESSLDRHVDDIKTQIERLAFANESIASIFDFREILHRYAGLSDALDISAANPVNQLFELSSGENARIASACLARKNRRKLAFHQSMASDEFIDMISDFFTANKEGARILGLSIDLAYRVNDAKTANALNALMSETTFKTKIATHTSVRDIPIIKTRSASSR